MKKKISILLVVIWMIIIFTMSSFNGEDSSSQSGFIIFILNNLFKIDNPLLLSLIIRKSAHFFEYLILGILVYNLIKNYKINNHLILSIIICFLYASSDEFHQLFVPGRSCQILDILIDTIGSFTGIIILKRFIK